MTDLHYPTEQRPTNGEVAEALRQARLHGHVVAWTKQRDEDRKWNVHVIVKGQRL